MRNHALFMALTLCAACNREPTTTPEPKGQGSCEPVNLCILEDHSLSMEASRTEEVTEEHLRLAASIALQCGGSVSFLPIADDTFDRTHAISVTPSLSLRPPPLEPIPPELSSNALQAYEQQTAFDREAQAYDERLNAWREDAQRRVERFLEEARSVLALPRDARNTDIAGALNRASVTVNRPHKSAPSSTAAYLLIASDGRHDANETKMPSLNGVRVLTVNGGASSGDLDQYDPVHFARVSDAFEFITSERLR